MLPEETKECCSATLKMKRIDILVSSSEDVQNERSVAERLIRWVAAELDVPISVSYSNWLRGSQQKDKTTARPASDNGEHGLLLCPYFWEHQDSKAEPEYCEHILNPGQYDLVINILWSRLGIRSAPMFVMPDGGQPRSATDYEVAWVLDQSKLTPGFPGLLVYRNRATPAAPLEPKEKSFSRLGKRMAEQSFAIAAMTIEIWKSLKICFESIFAISSHGSWTGKLA